MSEMQLGVSSVASRPGRLRVEPYQLVPLLRALDMPRPRLLLADGVGLGKTIQACLIAAELIARRRVHRILIVTPSGPLPRQWEQETRLRFGLNFTLITSAAELWEIRRAHELGANPFDVTSLCITTLDFAKQDHVLLELERSTWDLVIIDEAHHCVGFGPQGSKESTWRRRLAEVLSSRSDGLLLVTATPHDGHDEHFASLIALLDPSLVDDAGGFVGHVYRRHVIRRMKAHIRDPRTGAPMFRRRHVIPVSVNVDGPEYDLVREFHHGLSAFVLPRLHRGAGADDALAFVSLLKRSVSTISACVETLRVIGERIAGSDGGESREARRERARSLRAWRRRASRFGVLSAQEEANQEALEIEGMVESLRREPCDELTRLIHMGMAAASNDPKLDAMILEIRLIRLRYSAANILIYTEYTDSQIAAARALRLASGIDGEVLTIGGQDSDQDRALAAQQFSEDHAMILISTDSLAEGLNLHRRCFHLIHLDLPYNPNRLEQRNGRIDRYGQDMEPEIRYLYTAHTFEESLLLRLIAKYEKARSHLDVMPDTLGITAAPEDYDPPLMRILSEPSDDLFRSNAAKFQTIDNLAEDSDPRRIGELMREIDRAYDAFELMAVCHGWYGIQGLDEEVARIAEAGRSRVSGCDVAVEQLIAAVIEIETGEPAITGARICLPRGWRAGMEGLAGFEPTTGAVRFTTDADIYRDATGQAVEFIGRSHPLALRAVRHGCRLDGAVAMARSDDLGLLLTFEIAISVGARPEFRQVVAVLVRPHCPPIEVRQWLHLGATEYTGSWEQIWDRLFSSWADTARSEAAMLVDRLADQTQSSVMAHHQDVRARKCAQLNLWARVRADQLCGAFVPATGDLFGVPQPGPAWRHEADPVRRLVALATHPDTSAPTRRTADDVLTVIRGGAESEMATASVVARPIGMLMLVSDNAL